MTTASHAARIPGTAVHRHRSASHTVVAAFGVLIAMAGIEHGVGEMLQGQVAPPNLIFRSWRDTAAFEILNGEPAMTIVPNLLVTGLLTVVVSVVFIWAVGYSDRPRGPVGLLVLSVVLLLVGGGLAPPVIGVVLAIAATRIGAAGRAPGRLARRIAPWWRAALAVGFAGYVGLFPGMVLASGLFGVESEPLVLVLGILAFGGLFAALAAARAQDRVVAHGREVAR